MDRADVKTRLDPKKSYRNFDWMYRMYRKSGITHEVLGQLCGVSKHTIARWYTRLRIPVYLAEIRYTEKYKQWRMKVLKRDGMRCTVCGKRKRLHAHHIKQWDTHPKLRHMISNGVTLCDRCHKKRHPWMTLLYDNKDERKR